MQLGKSYAKKHESLQFNEENLRPEKSEASLLCNPEQGKDQGTGREKEAKKEMRKLTILVKKDVDMIIGEWRGAQADITFDEAYKTFSDRTTAATGIMMPMEQFKNTFELIRFQEILNN